jgi:glutathione S-transferase
MAKIKLYDFPSSPNCQRVKVVLAEKQLAYDIVPVDLRKKEQKNPDFLRLNPYGKVPVLTDGDTVLYESCIINEYLDEVYPEPSLMPKDPGRRAKIRILIDYGMNHLNAPYQTLREELAKDESDRDAAKLAAAKQQTLNLLKPFEDAIGNEPFLAGNFSLLDADLIPRFLRYENMGVLPDSSLPRLGSWLQRMKARPSVKAIV